MFDQLAKALIDASSAGRRGAAVIPMPARLDLSAARMLLSEQMDLPAETGDPGRQS
jgi:hypothetical protein